MRGNLMLGDLLEREPVPERLLSVRLPLDLLARLDSLARKLHSRKGEIVVAMLNEGLRRFEASGRLGRG
ncbi:MAG: ribbon-helix-helix protein, CopG family [Deltaproteobacteria bacterium]|nr:ribbon-helix-helix protein, CopG family [Deltaproteobacteria bacterium]